MAFPPSTSARRQQQPQKDKSASFSGWRKLGAALTLLMAILTVLLVSGLLVSIFRYGDNFDPLHRRSTIFRGHCPTASRFNLLIHLAINAIASAVLASSNFFMQVLVAPTRHEVNKAHRKGKWLEIGVQSLRNVFFLPRSNLFIWLLFALSSVPLHLVFNGTVVQSKASTDFLLVVAAEPFLRGTPFELPSILPSIWDTPGAALMSGLDQTLQNISASVSGAESSYRWERIELGECIRRYDNPDLVLTNYRHVVMVLGYANGTSAEGGWDPASVLPNFPRNHTNTSNGLWLAEPVSRTDFFVRTRSTADFRSTLRRNNFINHFDANSGRLTMDRENVGPSYTNMQVQFCMSERFEVPCRLDVDNLLLLLVCIMCALKCTLCAIVMGVLSREGQNRLMTPGDAIESFILEPDSFTVGMCTLSRKDPLFGSKHQELPWEKAPKQWVTPSRWAGRAIPTSVWLLSYALIGSSLTFGGVMLAIATRDQSVQQSVFGTAASNSDVKGWTRLREASLLELTMIANTPQLVLSMCYMVYNGLYTRMCAEFEWASFSTRYLPLRVTKKRGEQRSTYRLQLPYQWSIPLLLVSVMLHWLYSNTIYVSVYDGYPWSWPYQVEVISSEGLQYSTIAIVISFTVTMIVAVLPFYIARTKLPGSMVLAGGNSMVISAACHVATRHRGGGATLSLVRPPNQGEVDYHEEDQLVSIATGRLKWGAIDVVDRPDLNSQMIRHLGFGSREQDVEEAIEGHWYSG